MRLHERIHAKGLFFLPVGYARLAFSTVRTDIDPIIAEELHKLQVVEKHKAQFAHQCEQHNIRYDVHDNNSDWDKDLLIKESRFADLIVISGDQFYVGTDGKQPSSILREALQGAECPVVVVPDQFNDIEHLYMAYDGSKESMYAIKQFCYLFPQLIDLPTEIVYVKDDASNGMPDLESLKQFTRLKLDSMSFSKLHFKPDEHFATWIGDKTHVMLISGSFGQSYLHYAFKKSFSESVIRQHKLPIFIAHP
jgi:hypothetical protein